MKNNLSKKLLAALLCLCMVAAVIPAGLPTAQAADPLVYDFQQEGVPSNDAAFKTYEGGNWRYYAGAGMTVTAFAGAYANFAGLSTEDNYIAFEIDNVASGVYDVALNVAKAASGGIGEFYIIPYSEDADVIAECTPDKSLGTVDFYNDGLLYPGDAADETLKSFAAYESGKYLFVMRATGDYNSSVHTSYRAKLQAWLADLSMTRTGDATVESVQLDYDFQTGIPEKDAAFKEYNGGNWRYYEDTGITVTGFATVYANLAGLSTANNYIAFELDNIVAGAYDVSLDVAKHKSGAIVETYIIPKTEGVDVLAACTAKTSLGTVDFYNDGLLYPWDAADETLKSFNAFEDGTYLFVIRATGDYNSGASGYKANLQAWIAGLSMKRTGDPVEPSADAFTLGFGSSNGGVTLANVYNATIAANKWKINTDETDMIDQLTNTGRHSMEGTNTNFKIYEDEVLAYDFEAAVAGDYELVLAVGEYTDYGVNAEVFVNDVSVGKMFNDNNSSTVSGIVDKAGTSKAFVNKGFGKVTLKEGVNTLKIKGLAPDVIDAYEKSSSSDRAGGTQLYLSTATFTPKAASDVVVDRVEITCPNNSISIGGSTNVSAKAIMSDGSEVSVTPKTITTGIIDSASGTVNGIGAGLALVEAEYEKDGVWYEDQVVISVTNDAVFGNVYAYIDNDTVTFLGGIKTINGYKEVGFDVYYGEGSEVSVGTRFANPVTTTNVYEKITVGGNEYGAAYFGAEGGYIFCIDETVHVTAGETILIRPFAIDLDGNKVPYGQQYTMVVK